MKDVDPVVNPMPNPGPPTPGTTSITLDMVQRAEKVDKVQPNDAGHVLYKITYLTNWEDLAFDHQVEVKTHPMFTFEDNEKPFVK